ncbi:MAG TPA: hypothetical protein VIZ69_00635 [Thermoanaerobaculia bacterium]
MAEDDLDRDLGRRFGELRAADDAKTPGFAALLARIRSPRVSRPGWRPALALGAAAAAAVIAISLRPSREHATATTAGAAIAEWKSPTGSLLQTPGDEIYREPPPAAAPLPRWIFELESPSPGASAPSTPARKGAAS